MSKGNAVKIQTLVDNLNVGTIDNPPTGSANLYMALYVTDPMGGNTGTETNYSGYARQPITFGTPAMNGTRAEAKNTNSIEFPTVPSNSGTVAFVAILNALTGGTLIYYGSLGATYTLAQGVKPTVPIGSLSIFEN